MKFEKTYIGDGVYVDWDGYHLVLTTEDGISATNTICLEPAVQIKLVEYIENMIKQDEAKQT